MEVQRRQRKQNSQNGYQVCMFKNIKDVQQLLVIKPKRYILLHSNRATHLQCDSLLFRGRFLRPKSEIAKTRSHEGRMEMRPRLVFSRSPRAVCKNK